MLFRSMHAHARMHACTCTHTHARARSRDGGGSQQQLSGLTDLDVKFGLSVSLKFCTRARAHTHTRPPTLPIPTIQKVLARAVTVHRPAAARLADQLERQDQVAVPWFHSCSLPGSGSFLHVMASVQRFGVSSELFRAMLCIRLGALIPLAMGLTFCTAKCG